MSKQTIKSFIHMKNKIILVLVLASSLCTITFAQTINLQSLCNKWNILEDATLDGDHHYRNITQYLTSDTVIGLEHYVKIEGGYCNGALREGTDNDVYYVPSNSTHEYLLYAFNAQVGDTLNNLWYGGRVEWNPNGHRAVVKDITDTTPRLFTIEVEVNIKEGESDSVTIPHTIQWVEGVGLISGPCGNNCPAPLCEGDIGTYVLCAYQDDEQVYISDLGKEYGCEYSYQPIFTDGKSWNYLYEYISETDSNQHILTTRTYSVLGDTSIWYLNHTYKYLSNYPHWLFREDAEKQKVYTVSFNDGICDCADCYGCNGVEVVLYDFSAEKGDTLDVFVGRPFAYSYFFKYVVKDVYYKAITPNGEELKHIELTPTKIPDKWYREEPLSREITWIEGIGNNTFELVPETDNYGLLMCVSEGDNLIYSTELGSQYDCYVDTIINRTALKMIDGINIRLVVTDGMLLIESNDDVNDIAIYDLQGKQVMQSDKPVVDMSPLSSGLYLVVIQTNKGLWSDKFIVK